MSQLRLQLADAVRNSPTVWKAHAVLLAAKAQLQSRTEDKLLTLANAYRRWPSGFIERTLRPWLSAEHAQVWRDKKIGWSRFSKQFSSPVLTKSLILKPPGPGGEKGVLYLSFEYNWLRLLQHHDLKKVLDEYLIVGASSWSPPDFSSHWALAHVGPDPIFMQISNPSDTELYRRFAHDIRPIPIMASDWIDPKYYAPKPHAEREIDLLMVAGWSYVKRHWLLFEAMRKMRQKLRVVLIGQDADGRTSDDVWREAKSFGVADRIELLRDQTIADVTRHQCNTKAAVIFSAREGSCVVVAESMFADAPVGMMHDAHVGSRAYINPETGVLLRRETIGPQLDRLIDDSAGYRARAWATANISCHQAIAKLEQILRDHCVARGLPWTRGLAPMCWRPDPMYVEPAEPHDAWYEDLKAKHGISVWGRTYREG